MTDLKVKLKRLGIKEIDDQFYHQHLKDWQLRGHDVSEFKYYKMYGDKPMPYTERYLEDTPLDVLIERDKENNRLFEVSLKTKIEAFYFKLWLKVYVKFKRFKSWIGW